MLSMFALFEKASAHLFCWFTRLILCLSATRINFPINALYLKHGSKQVIGIILVSKHEYFNVLIFEFVLDICNMETLLQTT